MAEPTRVLLTLMILLAGCGERGHSDQLARGAAYLASHGIAMGHLRPLYEAPAGSPPPSFRGNSVILEIENPILTTIEPNGRTGVELRGGSPILSADVEIRDPASFLLRFDLTLVDMVYNSFAVLELVRDGAVLLGLTIGKYGNEDFHEHDIVIRQDAPRNPESGSAEDRARLVHDREQPPFLLGETYTVYAGVRDGELLCQLHSHSPAGSDFSPMLRAPITDAERFTAGPFRLLVRGEHGRNGCHIEAGRFELDGGTQVHPPAGLREEALRAFCSAGTQSEFAGAAKKLEDAVRTHEDQLAFWLAEAYSHPPRSRKRIDGLDRLLDGLPADVWGNSLRLLRAQLEIVLTTKRETLDTAIRRIRQAVPSSRAVERLGGLGWTSKP